MKKSMENPEQALESAPVGSMTSVVPNENLQQDETQASTKQEMNVAQSGAGGSGKGPIQPYEVTTYEDFRARSVVGDGLEGHEIWQHANLNENGYATTRLSSEESKKNIVIALPHEVHVDVNQAQYSLDARGQSPLDNIKANADILYNHDKVPNSQVDEGLKLAIQHYNSIKK